MPITDELIEQAVQRYFRERDRYRKLADEVEQIVRRTVERNAIRATVQSRAKEVDSFRGKLLRFKDKPEKQAIINTVDDVFEVMADLAAVRVSTYIDADRERVVNLLKNEFENRAGYRLGTDPADIEVKPPEDGSPPGKSSPHYRATHCEAYLRYEDIVDTPNANLMSTPCEIQVCSLLAHVWNEIEHDLGYKPHGGELSTEEQECLEELALKTREGDTIIARLVSAAEEKLKVSAVEFKSPDDFYQRLKDIVPLAPEPRDELRDLHYDMVRYRLSSPRLVVEKLLTDGWQARVSDLRDGLNAQSEEDPSLPRFKSYDVLAILFAAEFGKQLIAQNKKARLPETRLVKLAKRIKKL